MTLTFGSLFAGIGGIDLGLERAGMRCAWQVEIDEYCQKVLTKHWPDVPKYRDVRSVGAHNLASVDLIAGGFPCPDISEAGRGAGLDGERSGLWFEFLRIICELRPRYALVENVSALLTRGMGTIIGGLAEIGYDTEWQSIPAAALGAPHFRERVLLVAYPKRKPRTSRPVICKEPHQAGHEAPPWSSWRAASAALRRETIACLCRDDDGVPHRVDRLRGLGNAVVPQVAEFVGRCIVEANER